MAVLCAWIAHVLAVCSAMPNSFTPSEPAAGQGVDARQWAGASAREPVLAYVGLGANLGDAAASLRSAMAAIGRLPHTRLVAESHLYRSAPVEASGPDFVNAVVAISTRLPAPSLMKLLLALEQGAGRERPYRHAPRTLDLDLLRYGSARMASALLTLPHPRLTERAFVLQPLAEIAPALVTPVQLAAVAGQRIERLH